MKVGSRQNQQEPRPSQIDAVYQPFHATHIHIQTEIIMNRKTSKQNGWNERDRVSERERAKGRKRKRCDE